MDIYEDIMIVKINKKRLLLIFICFAITKKYLTSKSDSFQSLKIGSTYIQHYLDVSVMI